MINQGVSVDFELLVLIKNCFVANRELLISKGVSERDEAVYTLDKIVRKLETFITERK